MRHSDIIEEKKWLGATADHIVNTHGHKVDPHGVMAFHQFGDLKLGANTVGARNQNGIFVISFRPPFAGI